MGWPQIRAWNPRQGEPYVSLSAGPAFVRDATDEDEPFVRRPLGFAPSPAPWAAPQVDQEEPLVWDGDQA